MPRPAREDELAYCMACGDRLDELNRTVITLTWPANEPGGRRYTAQRWGFCTSVPGNPKPGCQQLIAETITAKTIDMKRRRTGALSGESGGLRQNW